VQGGRTIPPEIAAPLAEHIATFIAAQTAPLFLIAADCAEWARDLVSAGQANAGRALLGALLTLAPARENGTGNE
jgi:hypothetical protein